MRWKKKERSNDIYWRPWFAWYPVIIEDTRETVWLEWIWRHCDRYDAGFDSFVTVYRYRSDVSSVGANLKFLNTPEN